MNTAAFLTYTFLTAYTPGPNNILVMTHVSRDGLKRTLPFMQGMLTGFFMVMLACALFSSGLYRLIPSVTPVMQAMGAGYLVFLAWSIWRDKPAKGPGRIIGKNSFAAGMALQFVNVKIILYGITALSSYVLPNFTGIKILIFFCVLLTMIAVSGNTCWALFGAVMERVFKRRRELLNTIMALLLLYCAVALFR